MDKELKQLIRVVKRTSLNQRNPAHIRKLAKEASKVLINLSKQPQSVVNEAWLKLIERKK